jgi:hypothetical protein
VSVDCFEQSIEPTSSAFLLLSAARFLHAAVPVALGLSAQTTARRWPGTSCPRVLRSPCTIPWNAQGKPLGLRLARSPAAASVLPLSGCPVPRVTRSASDPCRVGWLTSPIFGLSADRVCGQGTDYRAVQLRIAACFYSITACQTRDAWKAFPDVAIAILTGLSAFPPTHGSKGTDATRIFSRASGWGSLSLRRRVLGRFDAQPPRVTGCAFHRVGQPSAPG